MGTRGGEGRSLLLSHLKGPLPTVPHISSWPRSSPFCVLHVLGSASLKGDVRGSARTQASRSEAHEITELRLWEATHIGQATLLPFTEGKLSPKG